MTFNQYRCGKVTYSTTGDGEAMTEVPAALQERLRTFEARASDDEVKTDLELTCTTCSAVVCDIQHEDTLDVLSRTALDHQCVRATCRHCQRTVFLVDQQWINPEATGDDSLWRETCEDHNDTVTAEHEPEEGWWRENS